MLFFDRLLRNSEMAIHKSFATIVEYAHKSSPGPALLAYLQEISDADKGFIAVYSRDNKGYVDSIYSASNNGARSTGEVLSSEHLVKEVLKKDSFTYVNAEESSCEVLNSILVEHSARQMLVIPSHGDKYETLTFLMKTTDRDDFNSRKVMGSLKELLQESFWMPEFLIDHAIALKLTLRDDLTMAYNRRYLETRLHDEIEKAERKKTKLSFIFFDLNDFRVTNDRYGHYFGSKLLIYLTEKIMDNVRELDRLVRFGGDEFCVVLPNTDSEGAKIVASRILDVLVNLDFPTPDDRDLKISACFGIATYPVHAKTAKELVCEADRAMYAAKENKKKKIQIITKEISKKMKKRHIDV